MAFNRENLTIMDNNVKAGATPKVYSYWNEANDAVNGAGYFVDSRLAVGDQILVITQAMTSNAFYNIASVSNGAATAQANI